MAAYTQLRALCSQENPNPVKIAKAFDVATFKAWREFEPDELKDLAYISSDDQYRIDLVCACQMASTNLDCFDDWHAFHHVATAFNHRRASFEFLDALTYMEAAWACHVLKTLKPNVEFGLGVQRYLMALCMNDGLLFFPWVGGDGLNLCTFYPAKGLLDKSLCKVVNEVKDKWKSGILSSLSSSDVDDSDALHVQMSKIVNAEEYIRRSAAC